MAVKAFTTMSFDIEISGEAPKRAQAIADQIKRAEQNQERLNQRLKEQLILLEKLKSQIAVSRQTQYNALGTPVSTQDRAAMIRDAKNEVAIQQQRIGLTKAAIKENTELSKSIKNISQNLGWAERQFEKFGLVFSRVLSALASFVIINTTVQLIRGFVSSLIESNQLLEVTRARLRSLIPDTKELEKTYKEVQRITITTPFMVQEVVDAFALLKAFGGDVRRDMKSIADWAAITNRDINDTAVAFGKIINYSPRTGLLLSTRGLTESQLEAYTARYGDRITALNKLIQDSFGGTAQRIAFTFEGLKSNINDLWVFISQKLGERVFKELNADLRLIYETMVILNNEMSKPNSWLSRIVDFGSRLWNSQISASLKAYLKFEKDLAELQAKQNIGKQRQLTLDAGHATIFDADLRKKIQELGLNNRLLEIARKVKKEGLLTALIPVKAHGEISGEATNILTYYSALSRLLTELAEPFDTKKSKVQILDGLQKAMLAQGKNAQDIARAKETLREYLELIDEIIDKGGAKGKAIETLKIVTHEDDLDRYEQKLSEVTEKTLEFQKALSIGKAKLYGGERATLKQIVADTYIEIDRLTSLIEEKRHSIDMIKTMFGSDDPHVLIMQTDILNLRKQQIDLLKDALSMELELAKVSENWGDAFAKQLGRINNELEAFRDTLAGSVIEFFQSSGRGILNEILFGQKGEDITDKINDLRFQLLQVQGEKAGIQIIEDQEASLLSRINQLESERANIVGTILVESFQKLIDKLEELAINELLSHIIPSGRNSLEDIENKGVDVLGDVDRIWGSRGGNTNDLIIRRSAGVSNRTTSQIIFNGPVYGMDDFQRKVDEAARKNRQNLAVRN